MAKKWQDLGSKVNDHFKVGHYKSLKREKEDEKIGTGPKKESGTSDEKDETRRRLCDLGT